MPSRPGFMRKEQVRFCKFCGRAFRATAVNTLYCSQKCCQGASYCHKHNLPFPLLDEGAAVQEQGPAPAPTSTARSENKCIFCGREFVPNAKLHSFCSEDCREEANRYRNRNLTFPADGGPRPDETVDWLIDAQVFNRVCPECRKAFATSNKRKLFCSRDCCNAYTNRKLKAEQKQVNAAVAAICGQQFKRRKKLQSITLVPRTAKARQPDWMQSKLTILRHLAKKMMTDEQRIDCRRSELLDNTGMEQLS